MPVTADWRKLPHTDCLPGAAMVRKACVSRYQAIRRPQQSWYGESIGRGRAENKRGDRCRQKLRRHLAYGVEDSVVKLVEEDRWHSSPVTGRRNDRV